MGIYSSTLGGNAKHAITCKKPLGENLIKESNGVYVSQIWTLFLISVYIKDRPTPT